MRPDPTPPAAPGLLEAARAAPTERHWHCDQPYRDPSSGRVRPCNRSLGQIKSIDGARFWYSRDRGRELVRPVAGGVILTTCTRCGNAATFRP